MLREEILKMAGVNSNVVLSEGVKFFKFSKRFDKLIAKAAKSKNSNKNKFIAVLKKAREDFKEAEDLYEMGNKEKAKVLYNKAKASNEYAMKRLLNNEMKSFILRAGLFGGFASILFILGKGAFNMAEQGKLDGIMFKIESSSKDMMRELEYLGKEKDVEYYERKWAEIFKRSANTSKELLKQAADPNSKLYGDLKGLGEEVIEEGVSINRISDKLDREIDSLKKKTKKVIRD